MLANEGTFCSILMVARFLSNSTCGPLICSWDELRMGKPNRSSDDSSVYFDEPPPTFAGSNKGSSRGLSLHREALPSGGVVEKPCSTSQYWGASPSFSW